MTYAANIGSRPTLASGTYRIDPARSRVRFAIKEAFGLMTARGTFTIRDGTVTVSPDSSASSATATLDVASFKTDKPKRDSTVISKRFLDAAAHPTMTFTSTRLIDSGGTWTLTGLLTMRGVVSEVSLRLVSGATTVDGCRFTATARVDRCAAGVTVARGMISRWLDVEFDAIFNSARLGVAKPDPAIFRRVLAELGYQTAVFCDDTAENAQAACEAGLDGVHVPDTAALRTALAVRGLIPPTVLLILPDRDEAEELAAELLEDGWGPCAVHRDMLAGEDDAEDVDWVIELTTAPDGTPASAHRAELDDLAERHDGFTGDD